MPETLYTFLWESWSLAAQMAPYLLFGFVLAGILRTMFSEDWVKRHLGQRGFGQTVKAVLIGIPLPLCSCGVIPVAAGIRRQGGQRGATAAFTASTPQTGVDSIAATVSLLGWTFMAFKVVIAFVNGIVAGVLVDLFGEKDPPKNDENSKKSDCCASSNQSCCCSDEQAKTSSDKPSLVNKWRQGISFGLITLPRDLAWPLIIGIILAGVISTFLPPEMFAQFPGNQIGVYGFMTVISLPLYVCSTGSIPMAYAFLQAGVSPGAALLFLIAGPASNTATVAALWKLLGKRATLLYIGSIIATSWIFAALLDWSRFSLWINENLHQHELEVNAFQHITAGILFLVLLNALIGPLFRDKK